MARAPFPISRSFTKGQVRWRTDWQSKKMSIEQEIGVIANRLPIQRADEDRNDTWEVSPGGLVSGVKSALGSQEFAWGGWAGEEGQAPKPFHYEGIQLGPLALSPSDIENYYEGFCNRTLWPLYHDAVMPPQYHRHWWHPYVEVNRRFAEHAARYIKEGGTAWVHDYHLHLVPQFLRELRPDLKISFFLHIPFPPEELFAQIPWRKQLLEGTLHADTVAFQTQLGASNFVRLARRFTDAHGDGNLLRFNNRPVRVEAYPISVDAERLQTLATEPQRDAAVRNLREQFQNRVMFLGVDRLDYTKGIDVRLRAYETFLEQNPSLRDNCVFVQIAVPSREEVSDYQKTRTRVEELVGHINGRFGKPGRASVHYFYRSLPIEELVNYYLAADVMVVTPFRDGMNLVAKEYIASRRDNSGVLILSQFAGAAKELREALLVNPHDIDGLAARFASALTLPEGDREQRMVELRNVVSDHDIHRWARQCLEIAPATE